jgi:hypothetical protein
LTCFCFWGGIYSFMHPPVLTGIHAVVYQAGSIGLLIGGFVTFYCSGISWEIVKVQVFNR